MPNLKKCPNLVRPDFSGGCPGVQDLSSSCPGRQVLASSMSHMPSGWISGVREDLAFISSHPDCAVFSGLSVGDAISAIAQDPRYWNKYIKGTLIYKASVF